MSKRRRNLAYLQAVAAALNGVAPPIEQDEDGEYVDLRSLEYRIALIRAAAAETEGPDETKDTAGVVGNNREPSRNETGHKGPVRMETEY